MGTLAIVLVTVMIISVMAYSAYEFTHESN